MNEIQERRMLRLAAYLRTIGRGKFDMRQWFSLPKRQDYDKEYSSFGAKLFLDECGTKACAMGHACIAMPTLFRKKRYTRDLLYIGPNPAPLPELDNTPDGFEAAVQGFGITEEESNCLFGSAGVWRGTDGQTTAMKKATPKQVARQIELFVNDKEQWAEENGYEYD